MSICIYEAKSDTDAVFCIPSSVPWFTAWNQYFKFACKLYLKYTFYLFSMSCIRGFIEMVWHQNVPSPIQYGRNDKLETERLFWKFYNIILNETFKFNQTPFGRSCLWFFN